MDFAIFKSSAMEYNSLFTLELNQLIISSVKLFPISGFPFETKIKNKKLNPYHLELSSLCNVVIIMYDCALKTVEISNYK